MSVTRKYNWHELLHSYLLENKDKQFAWGSFDCALFSADAIQSFTGIDLASDFRGKYMDEAGATATIKAVTGGSTVEDAAVYVANKFKLIERKTVLLAQRGDLVIYQGNEGLAAGIVHLNGTHALFVSPTGLHRVPLKLCKRAWRVS